MTHFVCARLDAPYHVGERHIGVAPSLYDQPAELRELWSWIAQALI